MRKNLQGLIKDHSRKISKLGLHKPSESIHIGKKEPWRKTQGESRT